MAKKKIRVGIDGEKMDTENSLAKIGENLIGSITFPFLFVDEDENEIPKKK